MTLDVGVDEVVEVRVSIFGRRSPVVLRLSNRREPPELVLEPIASPPDEVFAQRLTWRGER